MAHQRIRFTRKDYEQLPEDWRAELIGGDLLMVPAPDPSHECLVVRLIVRLSRHLEEADRILGSNVDIHVDDENIVQPDVVVLPEGTKAAPRPWKIPTPVWVAEVLSPGTKHRDRGVKLRLYARKGIEEVWLVDPDAKAVEVHDLKSGGHVVRRCGETAASRALPGFAVDVAEFFSL